MDDALVADGVHGFWFGPPPLATRRVWFRKDADFDATVKARFGTAIAAALAGAFGHWMAAPRGALARVLLLDQFTRNAFRDTPAAFAGDDRALVTAEEALARGHDRALEPLERWFLYMPFEHAEDRRAQARSLALFGTLAVETGLAVPLEWAKRHADVVERFGRYPHRNAILGRESTPEEIAFLAAPGSGF